MAITKKGSRRIVVDTMSYRWTIRPRPTYVQALAQAHMSFAVELESGGQTTLLVTVDVARPDNWMGAETQSVSPSIVARAIRQALSQGWYPADRGSAFEIAMSLA